jgi:FdrA protein
MINGIALGFPNAVIKGTIGIIEASYIGIQELSIILRRIGVGDFSCHWSGGKGLFQEVGGITTGMAIKAPSQDPKTQVIVLLGKAFDKKGGRGTQLSRTIRKACCCKCYAK